MTKSLTIYERMETVKSDAAVNYKCDQTGFKITVSDPVVIDNQTLALVEAETVEARVTPEELVAIGYAFVAAGEKFKNGKIIDVKA